MVAAASEQFGGVDILVNNAGIYPSRPWHEVDDEEWDDVLRVNLRGCFVCARAVYPYMQRRGGGRIVNISSITFLLGFPLLIHYVSSKGGIVGFTRALAREVGPDNITVNCLVPGAFPTAAEAIHADPEGYNRHVLEQQALKRRGRPEDIGHAVLFLASEAASFITGQTIAVDGGWAMH
jgi:NAD(P)-dependent dehydrogenase (short-subunit alcohol dehydrogenase family)